MGGLWTAARHSTKQNQSQSALQNGRIGLICLLTADAAMEEDWFVFSFLAFGGLWPLPAAGAPPKGRKQKKRQIKLTRPLSFLHFIHFIFDELMKLREKKSCAIHEWSLFFSFSLWGGYGLVGQPRAPPRERKQREKTNGLNE